MNFDKLIFKLDINIKSDQLLLTGVYINDLDFEKSSLMLNDYKGKIKSLQSKPVTIEFKNLINDAYLLENRVRSFTL